MNEYAYLEDPENNLAVKKGKLIEEKLDQLIHTNLKRHDINNTTTNNASSNKRLVDQIYRYVQFLNMNRKQNQLLYDYTVSLRGKLQYMNSKTWTIL